MNIFSPKWNWYQIDNGISSQVLHPEAQGYESPRHLPVNICLKYKNKYYVP